MVSEISLIRVPEALPQPGRLSHTRLHNVWTIQRDTAHFVLVIEENINGVEVCIRGYSIA